VKLGAREKRVIVIGAAIAGAVLIYYAVTLLLPDREALSQNVILKKQMLLKERETLTREAAYKSRLEEYQKRLDRHMGRLLPGDNPNVAGAELQKILKDFADQNGVEITQKSIQPEKKLPNGLTKVTVRIDTNCGPDQLVQFLTAVENYPKFLTVDDFTVISVRLQKRYEIRPNMAVSGYISSPAKPVEK
jgi:hypothetical protein